MLAFFPAALRLWPVSNKKRLRSLSKTLFRQFLECIIRINLNHQTISLTIIVLICIFSLMGIFRLRVETNPVGFFRKDAPVSVRFHDIYSDLSGSFPINMVMESRQSDYFESPESLARIEKLQNYLQTLPGVDKALSFVDYLKLVNYATNRFEPEFYRLPEEPFEVRMLINSYRMLLGDEMMDRFVNPDFSSANILLLTHLSSSRDFLNTREKILDFVNGRFPGELSANITGFGMVISRSGHLLTSGQIKSLSMTLVLVFLIMFGLFLSWKVGFVAIIPNVFPILINFGLMGWLGFELSMFTSLIASIAIGLAVDDTIHYLVRYNREFRKDLDSRRALAETIRHMGQPIVFTTVAIGIGFSVLTLSSFEPTAVLGIMMVITLLSALVGDLIILPSLMLHMELVTLWDLVRIKMGKEPALGIPLFAGLSRAQVHAILMAGSLRKVEAGEILMNKGDESDFMYAVISGEYDVIDPLSETADTLGLDVHKRIHRLRVGDVVGEMGLIRSAKRSATVVATRGGGSCCKSISR